MRYWCIVENLYDNVALLRFEEDEVTRPVAGTLNEVGRTFATDDHGPMRVLLILGIRPTWGMTPCRMPL